MTDIDTFYDVGTLVIRSANAVLWLYFCAQVLMRNHPVPTLARKFISTVLIFGMFIFVVGALIPFGVPTDFARLLYTAFTAYAGIVVFTMITVHVLDD